ncbi:MAG: uracil-DNA glycosylase [Treponema sp.]|nr:uracil-DNA glycosylase [Treponema sp.]
MTANDKQKIASFLDLARDSISSGYRSEKTEYNFSDDTAMPSQFINQNDESANKKENTNQSDDQAAPVNIERQTLDKIAAEIKTCSNCPLASTRSNTVPGEGVTNPLVMVIGEGPGADEDKQGRPFVGKAGQYLDKMLISINLSRTTNCFIANIVKCRPPNNRDPHPEERDACAHFLKRQIETLKPKFILLVGNVAAQGLLNAKEPVGKIHGKFIDYKIGSMTIPLIVTYHPAAVLRDEAAYKRPVWEDLKLLRDKIASLN